MFLLVGTAVFALFAVPAVCQDPEIVDDNLPEVQRVGGTARLNCTVANKQNNNLFWIFLDTREVISMDNTITLQINELDNGLRKYEVFQRGPQERQTFMLVIRRLRQQDAGSYMCQVRIQNQNLLQQLEKNASLTVQVPPKIRPGDTTTVVEVDQNQNASLVCASMGIPLPNITWTRLDGGIMPTGFAQHRSHILPIRHASTKDMGVYRCVADNSIKPPDEYLCEVRVFHAPVARTTQESVGQAQNMRVHSRLDCIVNGYPTPSVRWERRVSGGRQVLTDDDFFNVLKITTDNQNLMAGEQWYILTVKNVGANDYTDYYCIAENNKGTASVTITLFETFVCQGPNCPSLASADATRIQWSPFPVILLTVASIFISTSNCSV